MTFEPLPHYRRLLNEILVTRIEKNQKYSLRAFAKSLGIQSSALSQILKGQRYLSEERATQILDRLDLSLEERELFLYSLACARVGSGLKRLSPEQKSRAANGSRLNRELSADVFKTIAEWYHHAILELTRIDGFKQDPAWIAKKLGISAPEVVSAIDRLKALELLVDVNGTFVRSAFHIDTNQRHITSSALKRRQRQIIEKSLDSLYLDPIEIRNHSARTVAIDPAKMPEAKARIDAFMKELCDFMAKDNPKKVYEMSIQLFPLEINETTSTTQKQESNQIGAHYEN